MQSDQLPSVTSLLLKGTNPNQIDPITGNHALIMALLENSQRVFNFLVELDGIDLNLRNRVGNNALMIAAYKKNLDAVQKLIDKGAEVNQTGWTALHYAAASGSNPIVRLLLENSAYIDAQSPNKTTPLMMAARAGHILTVKLLLDEGAELNLKNDAGLTALDMAMRFHHQEIVEGLRYRMAKEDKEKKQAAENKTATANLSETSIATSTPSSLESAAPQSGSATIAPEPATAATLQPAASILTPAIGAAQTYTPPIEKPLAVESAVEPKEDVSPANGTDANALSESVSSKNIPPENVSPAIPAEPRSTP